MFQCASMALWYFNAECLNRFLILFTIVYKQMILSLVDINYINNNTFFSLKIVRRESLAHARLVLKHDRNHELMSGKS